MFVRLLGSLPYHRIVDLCFFRAGGGGACFIGPPAYHHSTGPSPDWDIEAYIIQYIPLPKRQCIHRDAIGALPLYRRLMTSLRRRRRRYVDPLLVFHANSDPFILVVKVFVAIIDPRPDSLLYVAGNQVRFTEKAIGSKRKIKKLEAFADWSD